MWVGGKRQAAAALSAVNDSEQNKNHKTLDLDNPSSTTPISHPQSASRRWSVVTSRHSVAAINTSHNATVLHTQTVRRIQKSQRQNSQLTEHNPSGTKSGTLLSWSADNPVGKKAVHRPYVTRGTACLSQMVYNVISISSVRCVMDD